MAQHAAKSPEKSMTIQEYEEKRARKWRSQPEFALNTEKELYGFIREIGASTLSSRKNPLYPSLVQAINGSPQHAQAHWHQHSPYAELMENFSNRYLHSKKVFEVNLVQNSLGVVSRGWMTALYAILGEANLRRGNGQHSVKRKFSPFELTVHDVIQEKGPLSKKELRLAPNLWRRSSSHKLEKALSKLWKALKILRVGYTRREGTFWEVPHRWDPSLPKEASSLSREKAAEKLIRTFVETAVATNRRRISNAFAGILSPSETSDALQYLLLKRAIIVDKQLVLDGKRAFVADPNRKPPAVK